MVGGSVVVGELIAPCLAEIHALRIFDLRPPQNDSYENIQGDVTKYDDLVTATAGMEALIYLAMGNLHWKELSGIVSALDVNIKGLYLSLMAAHQAGITALKDHHLYSHKGRGPRSGEPIIRNHKHAIAISVEMNHRMMLSAPEGTSVMESSEQYLRSGVLALKLAAWIRELGYDATAHIDGNYELICPLVAVDAGLGTSTGVDVVVDGEVHGHGGARGQLEEQVVGHLREAVRYPLAEGPLPGKGHGLLRAEATGHAAA